jgi:hypothetical protein
VERGHRLYLRLSRFRRHGDGSSHVRILSAIPSHSSSSPVSMRKPLLLPGSPRLRWVGVGWFLPPAGAATWGRGVGFFLRSEAVFSGPILALPALGAASGFFRDPAGIFWGCCGSLRRRIASLRGSWVGFPAGKSCAGRVLPAQEGFQSSLRFSMLADLALIFATTRGSSVPRQPG